MTTTVVAPARPSLWRSVLRRWPAVLGLAIAALQLIGGVDRDGVSTVLFVATLCYLGAAVFERRWVAWVGVPVGVLVANVTELTGLDWWIGVAALVPVLLVVGAVTKAPGRTVAVQLLSVLGYGFLAVTALYLGPRVGLAFAGAAVASHAVWDVIHYRRNAVVSRSLAEFCMLLDVPLGVGTIVVALTG